MARTGRLLLLALSLWAVFFIRAHAILTLPVFVDESLHILRAQITFQFTDGLASFLPGKLLTYYYFALFNPQNHNGLWITREAIALFAPLSAALCFAIVKTLTRSFGAALLVVWLYALSPFLVFFERMALSDPFALTFALGLLWMSLLLARRPTPTRALVAGLFMGLALLAKLTTLPLVVMPILATFLFSRRDKQRDLLHLFTKFLPQPLSLSNMERGPGGEVKTLSSLSSRRALAICYGVAGLLMLGPLVYVVYQEVAQVEKTEVVTTSLFIPDERSRLEQVRFNVQTYDTAMRQPLGPMQILVVLGVLRALVRWRLAVYLLAAVIVVFGFIVVTSAFPSTRYLTIVFPVLLILMVVGGHHLWHRQNIKSIRSPASRMMNGFVFMVVLIFGAWFMVFALGFIRDTWQDPTRHTLGSQDEWEYFSHNSSGYGLRQAAAAIRHTEGPISIAAYVGSCHSLRFYFAASDDMKLYCPLFPFFDNDILLTADEWASRTPQTGRRYLLIEPSIENTATQDLTNSQSLVADADFLSTFPRPDDGVAVRIYVSRDEDE